MTGLLLDTNVLLRLAADPDRLDPGALDVMASPANRLMVSAIAAVEIEVKRAIGKLRIEVSCRELAASIGADWLSVSVDHAERLAALPMLHRDPFDRVLVAEALVEELVIVSTDATVRAYEVASIAA